MKTLQIMLSLSAIAVLAGCSSDRAYYSPTTSSYDYNRANAALETTVRAEIDRYGDLAATTPDMRIQARNGVVTLSGNVPSDRERQMLDDVVRNTSGVLAVNDQLQVPYPPTGLAASRVYSSPPAPVVSSTPPPVVVPNPPAVASTPPSLVIQASTDFERRIADRMLDQFHADGVASIWVENVSIAVVGSDVYLRGYVTDPQVHQAIVSSVKRIPGVRTVFDELQTH